MRADPISVRVLVLADRSHPISVRVLVLYEAPHPISFRVLVLNDPPPSSYDLGSRGCCEGPWHGARQMGLAEADFAAVRAAGP